MNILKNMNPLLTIRQLLMAIFTIAILTTSGCSSHNEKSPKITQAEQGRLDLSNHLISTNEIINLDGEWEFYWDQLLSPNDFISAEKPKPSSGYFSFPSVWIMNKLDTKRLSGTGFATYRLTLLPMDNVDRFSLKIADIYSAYKLWANGKLIAQSGTIGRSPLSEKPHRSLKIIELENDGSHIEFVLQVSNFHFRTGGVPESISIALPGVLEKNRSINWSLAMFFTGSLLMMGFYHIILYFLHRRSLAPLYFGVYSLLVVGYNITSNSSQWVASEILPWWNPVLMEYFSLACFAIWPTFLFRFLNTLYPDEFPAPIKYFFDVRIVIFFIILFFASDVALYWYMAFCLLQMLIYPAYYLQRIYICIKRGRNGAKILLVGLTVQFVVGINDALAHISIIDSIYLAGFAVFTLALSQSLALAKQFSMAFSAKKQLSLELAQNNKFLKHEIAERNKLEQKVIDISDEERRRISHDLHDGLCQELTGARLRASALALKQAGSEDEEALKQLSKLINEATINAYRTSRGLWPVEHDSNESGPSLESLVRDISKTTDINITFEKECKCEQCSSQHLTTLYRIAQEALANALKHSEANNILVKLSCCNENELVIMVEDDGVGFSSEKYTDGGLGIDIMAHRAKLIHGEFNIIDLELGGTRMSCKVSCDNSKVVKSVHDENFYE